MNNKNTHKKHVHICSIEPPKNQIKIRKLPCSWESKCRHILCNEILYYWNGERDGKTITPICSSFSRLVERIRKWFCLQFVEQRFDSMPIIRIIHYIKRGEHERKKCIRIHSTLSVANWQTANFYSRGEKIKTSVRSLANCYIAVKHKQNQPIYTYTNIYIYISLCITIISEYMNWFVHVSKQSIKQQLFCVIEGNAVKCKVKEST